MFTRFENGTTDVFAVNPDGTGPPTDANACKANGWKAFNNPVFKNQGDYVN